MSLSLAFLFAFLVGDQRIESQLDYRTMYITSFKAVDVF